jgi:LuxR family maltose regulon positive regulatory protein
MLRRWRLRAGLSQAALAERASLSAAAVAALEQGQRRRPYPHTLRQLSAALELDQPEEASLLELAGPQAPDSGPPISSAWSGPTPSTPLIGRESELLAVMDLLLAGQPPARFVTLTGPGGVGKTRLAIAVALEVRSHFADGAVFVELAHVADPRLVRSAIAHALNVPEPQTDERSDALVTTLRSKHILLVLDNFEQLIEAATFLAALVDACPGVTLLVTSRTALRVRAEHRFVLEPLSLPQSSETSLGAIADSAAVRLFTNRAVAIRRDFALTAETAAAVGAICRRLDGLPLAIELAAAHVVELPPAALESRLRRRLSLLTDGSPDLPERQQTLRATLDWSYALLPAAEQVLFRQLSVFAGAWTSSAAEAVCRVERSSRGAASGDIAPLLRSLIDRSLIRRAENTADDAQFEMLETVREYASELLAASGDAAAVRHRLTVYYRDLVETAEVALRGTDGASWVGVLLNSQDNLRAVLASAARTGDVDDGLRIASAVWQFWWMRGQFREGVQWLDELLAAPETGQSSQSVRAKAFGAAASLALATGDYARARERCEQAVAAARAAGDRAQLASSLHHLGSLAAQEGDAARAITCLEASLAHARAVGASDVLAVGLCTLGGAVRQQGDLRRASALLEQSLDLLRVLGNWLWEQSVLRHMAEVARDLGDWRTTEARHKEALRICQKLGKGYPLGSAKSFEGLADVAASQGNALHAARLLGAAARLRDEISSPVIPLERSFVDQVHQVARSRLGAHAFANAYGAGAALEPTEAVELALETSIVEVSLSRPLSRVSSLAPPPVRAPLISRERLLERLDGVLSHSTTLVVAPAGTGKTSLLIDWTARVGEKATVAWLTLERSDDDPVRFWRHVLAALENQRVAVGGHAHAALSGGNHGFELLVEALQADLEELETELVLILDDYHLLESAAIHTALAALLGNAPRRFHLLLSARQDPPLALGRRRAASDLVELRAGDLRFSEAEAGSVLAAVIGHDLAAEQVRAVSNRTEGWAAGLQLAALSLREARDTDTAIARFSGSDRFVIDYFVEEVLEELPDGMRQFVMATSVLSRLSGPLCDAVTATSGTSAMLQALDQKNVFVAPIGDSREWYRYHQLFAEVLRHTLRRDAAELEAELHERAIDWYLANGLIEDGIEQALSGRRWERAADLIGRRVLGLMRNGEEATANRWMAAVPDAVLQRHPVLSVLRVGALLQAGQIDGAIEFIGAAEQVLEEQQSHESLGMVISLRASAAVMREDRAALIHAERALELPVSVPAYRLYAIDAVARTHLQLGATPAAASTLERALPLMDAIVIPLATLQLHNTLGLLRLQEGRLRAASAQFEALLTMVADRPLFPRQQGLIGQAVVAYERDELDDAADFMDRFDEVRRELGRSVDLPFPWLVRAWIARARADRSSALHALDRCEAAARRVQHLRLQRLARAWRARLALDNHDLESALRWASDFDKTAEDLDAYAREAELLMRARVWLAQDDARHSLPVLLGALSRADQMGRTASVLAVSGVLAITLAQAGEADEAARRLQMALALAEPEGYVRVFIDEGAPLRPLLRALSNHPALGGYVARLLSARSRSNGTDLLTPRERDVLLLLADGLSNRAIAERLMTREATVKSHVHQLIAKFGVSTRTQVLVRARQDGLLS